MLKESFATRFTDGTIGYVEDANSFSYLGAINFGLSDASSVTSENHTKTIISLLDAHDAFLVYTAFREAADTIQTAIRMYYEDREIK